MSESLTYGKIKLWIQILIRKVHNTEFLEAETLMKRRAAVMFLWSPDKISNFIIERVRSGNSLKTNSC